MFRLNRLTDYAVVVMAQMSHSDARTNSAAYLADSTGIPLPTVAKIMNALARSDLVVSHRGAGGGYSLARPAQAITVADIIQAIEGPISIAACVEGSVEHCESERLCPMRGNWERVNGAIRGALQSVSLSEMSMFEFPPLPAKSAGEAVDHPAISAASAAANRR